MIYSLVRARRQSLSLQVKQNGEIVARAPLMYPKFLVDRFVASKSNWISKRRLELSQPPSPTTEYYSTDQLKVFIQQQIAHYSARMSLLPTSIRFTQVHSYWGTCSPAGVLSFNLTLRFTPPEAVTYVVVHELSHLRYRGHGKRFWTLVNQTYPESTQMRKLLRQHSHLSH